MDLLKNRERIHFVGIGGVGMSAIAQILLKKGFIISGSDIKSTRTTEKLSQQGIIIFQSHSFLNISDVQLVVYSSAISPDNPELVAARDKKIPIVKRAELLTEMMRQKIGIAVSGAHGKTTTASLAAFVLNEAFLNPTVSVGGIVRNFSNNALYGEGVFFVIEADESDGTFLYYRPYYTIITNIDKEHLDHYRGIEDIKNAYLKFANNTKNNGKVILCGEDKYLGKIIRL